MPDAVVDISIGACWGAVLVIWIAQIAPGLQLLRWRHRQPKTR